MTDDQLGTPGDLLGVLDEIATEAKRAREALARGTMPKGTSALTKIEDAARDAKRRALARQHGLDYTRDLVPAS